MSELLRNRGITDKKSWHKWALKNHPDRGGDDETFAIAKNDYGVFTPSDGFSYTYAQSYHNGGPSGKFCDIPKRTGCHNRRCRQRSDDMLSAYVWCTNPVKGGQKICDKCEKKWCNHLVKDSVTSQKRQCSNKQRPDDIYCSIHSKKPPLPKDKRPSIQCSHLKKNGERCKSKSKEVYCHRHEKFHKK